MSLRLWLWLTRPSALACVCAVAATVATNSQAHAGPTVDSPVGRVFRVGVLARVRQLVRSVAAGTATVSVTLQGVCRVKLLSVDAGDLHADVEVLQQAPMPDAAGRIATALRNASELYMKTCVLAGAVAPRRADAARKLLATIPTTRIVDLTWVMLALLGPPLVTVRMKQGLLQMDNPSRRARVVTALLGAVTNQNSSSNSSDASDSSTAAFARRREALIKQLAALWLELRDLPVDRSLLLENHSDADTDSTDDAVRGAFSAPVDDDADVIDALNRASIKRGDDNADDEEDDDDVATLARRIVALPLPPAARKPVLRDLRRLQAMQQGQPELPMMRNYLDIVAELPWGKYTEDTSDIRTAEAQLDKDHSFLTSVKRRIVGFLAVRQLLKEQAASVTDAAAAASAASVAPAVAPAAASASSRRGAGAILCLVGPPGCGKTSLGESVAAALGRKFIRVALGGVSDEAEIRGHRRTYIGAFPGRMINALRRCGSANPVVLLDEVDKLGVGVRGDPAAALLELLDPAQNHAFVDAYLGVPFDVSSCLFIATANSLATISAPLLDRMEVIELDGYTVDEKVTIGREFLVPRQTARNGLPASSVNIPDDVLRHVVVKYTLEAGVRGLEQRIGQVCRHVAVDTLRGRTSAAAEATTVGSGTSDTSGNNADQHPGASAKQAFPHLPVTISVKDLDATLGKPMHSPAERWHTPPPPGVCAGLAWTPAGGDLLFVETALMPGSGAVVFTGQLGDVMSESVKLALAWIRATATPLALTLPDLKTQDLHVHFPAGAVPKDGPSAGVAIVCAVYSLLSGRPVPTDVAMTGEVTLTGRVTAVGGVKAKVMAAHRAGVTRVVLPRANVRDLDELPQAVHKGVKFVPVDTTMEALLAVFQTMPTPFGDASLPDTTLLAADDDDGSGGDSSGLMRADDDLVFRDAPGRRFGVSKL